MEEAPIAKMTPKFVREKNYKVKLNDSDYNLLISSFNESINFLLSPLTKNNIYSYEENYNFEKLSKINKIFLVFDSIETIGQSIEQMIENNKYSIIEKNENVEINLKVTLFDKLIDINLTLKKKAISQNQINKNIIEQINDLNDKIGNLMQQNKNLNDEIQILKEENKTIKNLNEEIQILKEDNKKIENLNNEIAIIKEENKQIKILNEEIQMLKEDNKKIENLNNEIAILKEENKQIKNLNDEIEILKEENKKIKNLNNEIRILKEENKKMKKSNEDLLNLFFEIKNNFNNYKNESNDENFKFKFKPGNNYTISKNGLVATKTIDKENKWNCSIIGDKEIPKNKISKWKIRINNIAETTINNSWNILIGIGPDNVNEERNFHRKCWSLICGESKINIRNNVKDYINKKENKRIKNNDIIEVILDRQNGNLSFEVNGINYGIACSDIPKEDKLYPVINIFDNNQSIEILN